MKSAFLPLLSRSISTVAACTLLGASTFAQAPATPAPGAATTGATTAPVEKPKPLAATDETYVKAAIKSLNYQVQLAKAAQGVTDQNQTRFRDTTAKDMAAALAALNKIADAHALKVPAEVSGTDKVDLDRVTKAFAKPDKIDPNKPVKEWVAEFVKESKRLDHETEQVGKTSQDADLKTYVTNYGPSIRSVFTSADGLQKQLMQKKK